MCVTLYYSVLYILILLSYLLFGVLPRFLQKISHAFLVPPVRALCRPVRNFLSCLLDLCNCYISYYGIPNVNNIIRYLAIQ